MPRIRTGPGLGSETLLIRLVARLDPNFLVVNGPIGYARYRLPMEPALTAWG